MNQLANILDHDGKVIGTVARGLAFDPLFKGEIAKFYPLEMNWLGSLNSEIGIGVTWHTTPVKSWKDLKDYTLTVGATGSGSDSVIFPAAISEVLGFEYNIVAGYPGLNDVPFAMERGEVEAPGSWSYDGDGAVAEHPSWFESRKVQILYQSGLSKHPDLPNVPSVIDLAKTKHDKQVLRLLFSRNEMGRPFVAPPEVPEDRVEILRKAIRDTLRDPKYIQEIKNQEMSSIYVSGEAIQDIIEEAYSYPDDVIEVIRSAM